MWLVLVTKKKPSIVDYTLLDPVLRFCWNGSRLSDVSIGDHEHKKQTDTGYLLSFRYVSFTSDAQGCIRPVVVSWKTSEPMGAICDLWNKFPIRDIARIFVSAATIVGLQTFGSIIPVYGFEDGRWLQYSCLFPVCLRLLSRGLH